MQITSTTRADGTEVKLQGRMDAGWSDQVSRSLEECLQTGQHTIWVDMTGVDYISSAGLRVLVLYAKKLKQIQGGFCIASASAAVTKVLKLTGLESLLATPIDSAPDKPGPGVTAINFHQAGATAELFELKAGAELQVRWPGEPGPWIAGSRAYDACETVEFPEEAIGIGLGGFIEEEGERVPCFGEFLAAAGAAVCLPADGSNKPDYMLQEGALTPSLKVAYGAVGLGEFRYLLRFDKGPQQSSLPLSSIVKSCLQANNGRPVGLVMVAETASLIGACLHLMPSGAGQDGNGSNLFSFPAIRKWLSFTAEPAFLRTTSLVVGFAAMKDSEINLRLLKPADPTGELLCHFHAAAFPYQPVRRGKINLRDTVRPMFESGQVLGLLHLLNDWREANGAGESRFLRGACWWGPMTT